VRDGRTRASELLERSVTTIEMRIAKQPSVRSIGND
jgi:hypothetical protein